MTHADALDSQSQSQDSLAYGLLIIDRVVSGSERAKTLPHGAARFGGHRHVVAGSAKHMQGLCRALGLGDDFLVMQSEDLDLVQIETAPLKKASIDPVLQYVNHYGVLEGDHGTQKLEALQAACKACASPTARAFLIRA